MISPKTHFEQVPLEVVKKIVAEQIKKEEAAERTAKVEVGRELLTSVEAVLWGDRQR